MLGTVFIGRYKVIEELGRGGMGIVYRGEDPALDRPVAIKVLPPKKLSLKKAIKRFLREARVSARLDHPFIIKIFDIGEEEGIYHIVMEYVSGRTLREMLEERESVEGIDIPSTVKLFKEICQAIEYAHNLKIIHRDIKPENIMVTTEGTAKVMDFGLAVLDDRHSLTEIGQVMGTIAYFSPEQARGEPADARSDIYSLGVVFYEMLANNLPFTASNPSEMIEKHLKALPILPTRQNPNIPPQLESLILKALRKLPEERFESVSEIILELEAYLQPRPKREQPVARSEMDLFRNHERKPGLDRSQYVPPVDIEKAIPPSVEEEDEEDYDADLGVPPAHHNASSMANEIHPADAISGKLPSQLIPPEETDFTHPQAASPIPFQPSSGLSPIASPQWMIEAKDESEKDRYNHFLEKLRKDAAIRSQATQADATLTPAAVVCSKCGLENTGDRKYCTECGSLLAPSNFISAREAAHHNDQGVIYINDGEYEKALFEFQQALARDPDMAEARFNIARVYLELGEFKKALEEFRDYSVLQPDDPSPYLYLADIYRKQDRKDLAINEYIRAIKLDPNDPSVRCQLAFLYSQQGALPQAINEYRAALSIDINTVEAHRQLGFIFAGLEQVDEAIKELEWVIKLDPGNQQAYKWLGNLYSKRKRYSHAERAFNTALTIDPGDAAIHAQLGSLYEKQNKEEMAFQTLFRAIAIDQGNMDARTKLAEMYMKHNQPHMAVKELEAVINHHPNEVNVHQQLGELYIRLNRFDEALQHFEKTVTLAPESADIHNKLGRLYLKKDYNQLSVLEYQKAVNLDPYNPSYREDLGMAYYCQNRNDLAIEQLKKAVTLDSRNVDYFKALGIMLEEENRLEEATQMLKKAEALDPRDPMTHGLLGKVYYQKGLMNMAIYEYQKGIELQPTNYLLHIYMAKAYSKLEKTDYAIDSFRKAINLMPGAKGGEYKIIMGRAYVDLGKAYLEKGDLNLAKEVLETAYKLTPKDAKILHYLALIQIANKNFKNAIEYITAALDLEPNNADIIADLGNLYIARGDTSRGDTELAIKAYSRAIDIAPDKFEYYELLTKAFTKAGRFLEAIDVLRQARAMDSINADHYHWLAGGLFLKIKDPMNALDELLKAVALDDKNWNYFFDLGSAYRLLNQPQDAYTCLERAHNLCSDNKSREAIFNEMKKLKSFR